MNHQIRTYWSVKKGPRMAREDETEHQRPFFFNAKVCMLMFSRVILQTEAEVIYGLHHRHPLRALGV